MTRRTQPVYTATTALLEKKLDLLHDPEDLKAYREALSASDLPDGALPEGLRVEWIDLDGIRTAKISAEGAAPDKILFHIHGGGWCGGVPCTGLNGMLQLQKKTGFNLVSIDYSLAPEHPHPQGLLDCVKAYRALLGQGYRGENILLIGESAGGYYCLAMTHYLKDHGLPLPAALCLISPACELPDLSQMEALLAQQPDNVQLNQSYAFAKMYMGDQPADAPYMSPVNGDFHGFPPMLFQCGGCDFVLDRAVRCAAKAMLSGVDVSVHIWEFLPHVFFLLGGLPEAEPAREELARFIGRYLN